MHTKLSSSSRTGDVNKLKVDTLNSCGSTCSVDFVYYFKFTSDMIFKSTALVDFTPDTEF